MVVMARKDAPKQTTIKTRPQHTWYTWSERDSERHLNRFSERSLECQKRWHSMPKEPINSWTGKGFSTFLVLDQPLSELQGDKRCPVQDDVGDGLPGVWRQTFWRTDKVSCSIVDYYLHQSGWKVWGMGQPMRGLRDPERGECLVCVCLHQEVQSEPQSDQHIERRPEDLWHHTAPHAPEDKETTRLDQDRLHRVCTGSRFWFWPCFQFGCWSPQLSAAGRPASWSTNQDGIRVQTVLAAGFEFWWLLGLKRRWRKIRMLLWWKRHRLIYKVRLLKRRTQRLSRVLV